MSNAAKGKKDIKAWFVGGGIASLAGAAFMVRDGGVPGENITVLDELPDLSSLEGMVD